MTADLGPAARRRPVPSPEDRMADARTDTPHTFRTYLDATERDQLDARAACAEQERDEALDARDVVRAQLQDALWTAGQHATTAASLRQRLDQATAERDNARRLAALTAEQEAANAQIIVDTRAERDQARRQRDGFEVQRDQAYERVDELTAELEDANTEIRRLFRQRDQARAAVLGSADRRAQEPTAGEARRLLDQAIVDGLPLAGGRVRKLLKALRHELVRVDAKRAEKAEG